MDQNQMSSRYYKMENVQVREPFSSNTKLTVFQKKIEKIFGVHFGNYGEFHRWSTEHYPQLWEEVWNHLDILHSKPYTQVIDETKCILDIPEWFPGARLNYTENMLRYPECDKVAIIVIGEERKFPEKITFGQLREEVALLSAAFRKAGLGKGDIVACYMSNRKEAITSFLAAGALGALFSAVNPLMGAKAVVERFQQVSPKILVTIDRHLYDGKEFNILDMLPSIVNDLPTLKKVIIVPSNENSVKRNISSIPNSCFMTDFLETGRTEDDNIPPLLYEQLPFSHPLVINYTSGTTGAPKGIVHSAGIKGWKYEIRATLLVPLEALDIHENINSSDVVFAIYLAGWVSWNYFMSVLGLGATIVLYEGVPFFHHKTCFWDLIDEHQATVAFLTPGVLEEYEKKGFVPGPHNSLKSLHTITSGSCHVKAHTYDFVYRKIKKDVFFSVEYGSTEFMSMFAGPCYNHPVHKEEIQTPRLGIDLCCYNDKGQRVYNEVGELVLAKPFPSMPLYFWKDELKERYMNIFFSKFPGVWCQGDICSINSKTGGLKIFGRSDETINQRGARFGSSEIYSIVNTIPGVHDSLCVSKVFPEDDEIAILFVMTAKNFEFSSSLVENIREQIEKELSDAHVPEIILQTPAIPYNLNGKKMEIIVKKILSGSIGISKANISNPDFLDFYHEVSRNMVNQKNCIL